MLKQTAILAAIIGLIKTKYNYKVYADEVVEGFKQPCFFVKLVKRQNAETVNFNSNALSVIITYFASPSVNKEIAYMDMTDELELLFGTGFKADNRHVKIKNFTGDRIGEKKDILQIMIAIEYLDSTNKKNDEEMGYIPAETIQINTKLRTD